MLTKFNFSSLFFEDKVTIKNEGRPKPILIIVKESKYRNRLKEVLIKIFTKRIIKETNYFASRVFFSIDLPNLVVVN